MAAQDRSILGRGGRPEFIGSLRSENEPKIRLVGGGQGLAGVGGRWGLAWSHEQNTGPCRVPGTAWDRRMREPRAGPTCVRGGRAAGNSRALPDYARKLPEGGSALRLVTDPARMPDLLMAYVNSDSLLLDAIDQSLVWCAAPSSRQYFPFEGITHRQAQASLVAMRELLSDRPPTPCRELGSAR